MYTRYITYIYIHTIVIKSSVICRRVTGEEDTCSDPTTPLDLTAASFAGKPVNISLGCVVYKTMRWAEDKMSKGCVLVRLLVKAAMTICLNYCVFISLYLMKRSTCMHRFASRY